MASGWVPCVGYPLVGAVEGGEEDPVGISGNKCRHATELTGRS
jgi:hypothetical protein